MAILISGGLDVLEVVVCVCGGVYERQVLRWDPGCVLVCRGSERQDAIADCFVILRRRVGPDGFDRVPEWMAEPFDVRVAVLRDYRFDG